MDQPCTFAGNSAKSDQVLIGLIRQDTKPMAAGAEGRFAGANFRLTDNLGFIKGKRCQNLTFLILRTRFICWNSEKLSSFTIIFTV